MSLPFLYFLKNFPHNISGDYYVGTDKRLQRFETIGKSK